ncbi:Linoleate 13S-lipoxygenase 2-1, chloroplastic [Linum perenne]
MQSLQQPPAAAAGRQFSQQLPAEKPLHHINGGGLLSSLATRSKSSSREITKSRVMNYSRSRHAVKAILGGLGGLNPLTATKVKAVVTVKQTVGGFLADTVLLPNTVADLLGTSMILELIPADLDSKGKEKSTVSSLAHFAGVNGSEIKYEASFGLPSDFGLVGAMRVDNLHIREMFLKDIVISGFPNGAVNIECESWVPPKISGKPKRIFFTTKSYLPSDTPNGLKKLRNDELVVVRGSGQGERRKGDRIYDYDVYNDLGEPDRSADLKRPVLGGKEHPYPRRCRSGRQRSTKGIYAYPESESRGLYFYVPRDEEFSEIKTAQFGAKTLYSVLHALVPTLETILIDKDLGFPHFTAINEMFDQGLNLPPYSQATLTSLLPTLIRNSAEASNDVLQFEVPPTMDRNSFFWFTDEEFARQTLAGVNPCTLQLITEWPLMGTLDSAVYGPQESGITKELIETEIKGYTTLEDALEQKKLFMLDYHDILLPFVPKARELEATTLYGSRTVFYLCPSGTLRPLAIELTRPPMDGKPQWKKVYIPNFSSATDVWLWRLAKAHVLSHDSAYHQLISHWLRTHCCTEPYIIAAKRQLSAMHPIHRLLSPHFRYTMEINALARQALINAGGVIESTFSTLKYSIEASSAIYDKVWRFDHEALPKDLISRGMAVEDPSAPHGVKLTIEDYPYANDGLLIWDSIKQWVTDYVNQYYPDEKLIASDTELQAWWNEVRNEGHADKKDEPWWPSVNTAEDLVEICTTIIWVASGHHAAVNFGQYAYGGFFPNQPTISRLKMPDEDPTEEEWKLFMQRPETVLLTTFPSQIQAAKVMAVLDVLSSHAPDEEYLGEKIEPAWADEPQIKAAFEKLNGRMKEVEGEIDARNADESRKNRNGAGIYPYELLKPFSEGGVTGKGIPYSISI